MRFSLLILLFFVVTITVFGQTDPMKPRGHYFKTTEGEYFEKVFNPWKYQYTQTQNDNRTDAANKVGQIIFWRSEGIYDNISKKYWKPDISFDIYTDTDSALIKDSAERIKSLSACDSINKGGDVFFIGHFILLSSSGCVNCASSSKFDYCRKIIKHILESVPDKDTYDWNVILNQFIISKAKFKNKSAENNIKTASSK